MNSLLNTSVLRLILGIYGNTFPRIIAHIKPSKIGNVTSERVKAGEKGKKRKIQLPNQRRSRLAGLSDVRVRITDHSNGFLFVEFLPLLVFSLPRLLFCSCFLRTRVIFRSAHPPVDFSPGIIFRREEEEYVAS